MNVTDNEATAMEYITSAVNSSSGEPTIRDALVAIAYAILAVADEVHRS